MQILIFRVPQAQKVHSYRTVAVLAYNRCIPWEYCCLYYYFT